MVAAVSTHITAHLYSTFSWGSRLCACFKPSGTTSYYIWVQQLFFHIFKTKTKNKCFQQGHLSLLFLPLSTKSFSAVSWKGDKDMQDQVQERAEPNTCFSDCFCKLFVSDIFALVPWGKPGASNC